MKLSWFFLAGLITLGGSLAAQQPAAEPTKLLPAQQARQMQEDVAVFRVLLQRSLARVYGLPSPQQTGLACETTSILHRGGRALTCAVTVWSTPRRRRRPATRCASRTSPRVP